MLDSKGLGLERNLGDSWSWRKVNLDYYRIYC